jgi:hypothetical protein
MNLSTATPVEIDTQLAKLYSDIAAAQHRLDSALAVIHEYVGDRKRGRAAYKLDHATATAQASQGIEKARAEGDKFYIHNEALKAVNAAVDARGELSTLEAECELIDMEYASRPWSRFIAVQDGHLHSGTRCAGGTIRVTTQLGWHPELSGKTEAEAVAELGPLLCTHCFPSAPVEWTVGVAKKKVAEGYCEGQGEQGFDLQMQYVSPRGKCPKCKQGVSVSRTGKVLRHKLRKA